MGTLVVTLDRAALFADSRYWVQAERELAGSGIELVKIPTGAAAHHIDWLAAHAASAARPLMVDGQVLALAAAQLLRSALDKAGITLRTDVDLLDAGLARPPGAAERAGLRARGAAARRSRARQAWRACARRWRAHGATHHFVSTVDDMAWITNLRGADVDYNPVFLAHLLIDADERHAVRRRRQDRRGARGAAGAPTASRWPTMRGAPTRCAALPRRQHAAGRPAPRHARLSPAGARRRARDRGHQPEHAVQEPQERRRGRSSCARRWPQDGAAMCEFYAWFEEALAAGERITELTIDEQPERRARQAPGLRRPELLDHRRLQRQRRDAALPRHAESHARDRRRRPAADRLRRPVPRRHHRHHARLADRPRQRRARSATTRWC